MRSLSHLNTVITVYWVNVPISASDNKSVEGGLALFLFLTPSFVIHRGFCNHPSCSEDDFAITRICCTDSTNERVFSLSMRISPTSWEILAFPASGNQLLLEMYLSKCTLTILSYHGNYITGYWVNVPISSPSKKGALSHLKKA